MILSLTFVNQTGAVNGMNQASPGSFIPETFIRWSQDILFDRVGELRRRSPYKTLGLFNSTGGALAQPNVNNQRVLGVVTTRNPNNDVCMGIITTDGSTSTILFYDKQYRKSNSAALTNFRANTVVFSRPALDGGLFIGFLENYGISTATNKNALYYWRGGMGEEHVVNGCTIDVTNDESRTGTLDFNNHKITPLNPNNMTNIVNGYPIIFSNLGTTTGGASTNTVYYVTAAGADFKVEDSNGTDLNFTGTGTTTVTFTIGAHATYTNVITGTFTPSKLSKGMFVYRKDTNSEDRYLGVLKEWATDGTSITLEKDCIRTYGYGASALAHTSANIKFVNVRPYIHNHGRGLITKTEHGLTVTSGTIGSEGEGHFASADLAGDVSGTRWALYRASDGEWLGDVASVTNNAALTLDSVYHTDIIPMNADEYVARPYQAIYTTTTSPDATKYTGCFNTTYAGYQWYANGGSAGNENRVVFSAYHDPESVDLSRDAADSIVIPGAQQMRGIATSAAGLVVFLDDKTYLIRGNYRANFSLEELYPEGCLSAQSIVEYGGGVFWASKNGIFYFDGASVRNLTETTLGAYYTDSIKTFDTSERRIYSFLYKDYLFLSFSGFASNYTPLRYEPVYADDIDNTPAIANFQGDDWDPDFTPDDFLVENNVPIYWKTHNMYTSEGTTQQNSTGKWSAGISLPNVTTSTSNAIVTNISLPILSGAATSTSPIDTITLNDHGLTNGTILRFTSVGGTGLTANTTDYYVINATQNNFQVSTSLNNSAFVIQAPATVSFVDTTPISVGRFVFGSGIPSGTTVSVINSPTQITLSQTSTNNTSLTVTNKVLLDNVATLTVGAHSVVAEELITVSNVDSTFNGTYKVKSVTSTTISYDKVNANVTSTAASGTVTWLKTIQIQPTTSRVNTWNKSLQFVWGPVNFIESMTFAIYLPTNAITAISNFDFRGFIKLDSAGGTKGYAAINAVNPDSLTGTYARLVDVDSMLNPVNDHKVAIDSELSENLGKNTALYYKGPDFYIQTKHYTVGDPILRKWFRQVMLNLYLLDGGIRMDIVDNEDNDRIDVEKKRHVNWELFEEITQTWNYFEDVTLPKLLSPNRSTWQNVQAEGQSWYEITDAEFTRRKKKISWRYPSAGFRLYQMNDYRPSNYLSSKRPHTVIVDSWNIGFKPMRVSRV